MTETTSPLSDAAKRGAPALRNRDKEMIPLVLVRAMFMLAVTSLVLVSYAVLTDRPLVGQPEAAPITSQHSVVLTGDRRGAVTVAALDGSTITEMSESEAGFISVVMRALKRVRLQSGVAADAPVRLVTYENGRIALIDDESNWSMELGHFGDLGKARFAELVASLPEKTRLN